MAHEVDLIVLGGSAGSFTALRSILSKLPEDLPASVLICQHMPTFSELRALDLLRPHSTLPVRAAEDGMALTRGEVIFAAPDTHMLVGRGHVHLRRGAHENNFRPAVDPLFRSAAIYGATRTVAVVLSGMMDDGAAGARAVARTGGRVLVQDPVTAEYPDMPDAALRAVPDAERVPVERIAGRIADLAGSTCGAPGEIPWQIGLEVKIASLEGASMENEDRLGELSPYNCPDCNGVLWRIEDGPMRRFRCHTGHAYTETALSAAQEEALDRSLFDSLRAHKGRMHLLREMAEASTGRESRKMLERRAVLVEEDADRLERIIKSRRAS